MEATSKGIAVGPGEGQHIRSPIGGDITFIVRASNRTGRLRRSRPLPLRVRDRPCTSMAARTRPSTSSRATFAGSLATSSVRGALVSFVFVPRGSRTPGSASARSRAGFFSQCRARRYGGLLRPALVAHRIRSRSISRRRRRALAWRSSGRCWPNPTRSSRPLSKAELVALLSSSATSRTRSQDNVEVVRARPRLRVGPSACTQEAGRVKERRVL